MPATAAAWHAGDLDGEHVQVMQKFLRDLPADIAPDVVADSESFLAFHAQQLRPDQLEKLAVQQLAMRSTRRKLLRRGPRPSTRLHLDVVSVPTA